MRDRIHLLSISLAMMLAAYVLVQVEADVASEEGRLISLINQERNSRGLDVLLSHPLLTQAARDYSREMMTHGFFSHVSEVDGSTVFDRIKRTGYYDDNHGPIVVRENIAFISGSANAASAHQGFMNSEGHRLNTIASDVNEVGVGITEGSFRSVYGSIYVEVFAYHVRDQETTTSVSTMISVSVTPNDITLQLGQGAIFAIHVDAGRSTSASIQVINLPSSIMWSIDKPSGVTPLDAKLTVIAAPTAVGMHTFSIVVAVAGQTRILSCRLNVLQPTEASTSTATLISSSSRTSSTTSSPQTSTITSVSRTQSSPSTSITLSTQTKTHSFTVETNRTPTISLQTSSSTRQTQASTTTTGRSTTDYIITRTTTSVISLPRLRCIIATAAFGSELSEQVQFLREFRENKAPSALIR